MAPIFPRSTARITLRRLTVSDLVDFQAYRQCEELSRYQGWVPQSDSEASAFLNDMGSVELFQPGIWGQIGIADGNSDKLIGDIGICISGDGQSADIGFTLSNAYHGKGLASEAVREAISMLFETSNIHRVIGITDSRNISSIQLLERVGMKLTSTDRAMFRGQECNEHTYIVERPLGLVNQRNR
ncbi:GNAT family N-acetyltransferase [Paraherbaspirillum soli]|uniref:GNAT family N-acetyltransferase n=1 Tax=Paraherbaspirillum soli TaxID=631222 RepID=A0ABW0MF72_9BURK